MTKLTNVWTYVSLIFIAVLFITVLKILGNEALTNPFSAMDNDSQEYIASLQGVNLTQYRASNSEIERLILSNTNFSQGNPKDYAQDFLFAKENGIDLEIIIKTIFGFPSMLLCTVFRMQCSNFKWLLDAVGWLLFLGITVALINYARKGTPDQGGG